MNLAWISLIALLIAIVVSCTTQLNVGILSLAFAWIVGVYFGGMKVSEVTSGFPLNLFLTIAGVTLLFSQAQANGTLERLAHQAVRICKGNRGMIPIMFFVLGCVLASMGPGNIATAALLAPMAMAVAGRTGIPAFLMAIMVGNGANSGALAPFAPTGIIVNGVMARIGMPGLEWQMYRNVLIGHIVVAFAGYFLLGGWKLFRRSDHGTVDAAETEQAQPFETRHWITLAVILTLITSVIFFQINVGMGAFGCAVLLAILRVADHQEAIKKMPWGVIIMVCGVTVLIALLEKTQGMDLFTQILAKFTSIGTSTAVTAFVTGLVSAYSSTSGVVLPAFLPTIPGLIQHLGGGDPVAIASSMILGGHLVDVSPLSTIGALCLAAAAAGEDVVLLFRRLLLWGMSMTVVGAVMSYLLFGGILAG